MRRLGLRLAMAVVGVTLVLGYGATAYLGYLGLRFLWAVRPDAVTLAVGLLGATLLSGYLSYRLGTAQLLRSLHTRRVPPERAPGLHRRIDRLVDRMDVDRPGVYVAEMRAPNALAVGGPNGGALVLDRRLLRLLAGDELEAIVAHELAHLERNDSLLQALAYSAGRTVVGLATVVLLPAVLLVGGLARGWAWIRGRPFSRSGVLHRLHRSFVHAVGLLLFGVTVGVRTHSRRREFAADDRAVAVTGDPVALARALRKIERVTDRGWRPFGPLSGESGGDEGPLARWLSTHPPVDERVERLLERADATRTGGRSRRDDGGVRIPID